MYLGDSINVFVRRQPGGDLLFNTINSSLEENQEALKLISGGVSERLGEPDPYRSYSLEELEKLHWKFLKLETEIRESILMRSEKYVFKHTAHSISEAMEVQRANLQILDLLIRDYAKLYYIAKNYRGRELTLTEINAWIEEAGRS